MVWKNCKNHLQFALYFFTEISVGTNMVSICFEKFAIVLFLIMWLELLKVSLLHILTLFLFLIIVVVISDTIGGSAIKQLLETLFFVRKICLAFTSDVIWMNTMCAVSLVNHLRALVDVFCP